MTFVDIQKGESIGDYVSRLERRVKELEPPEGFTIQEWHVGQVYTYLLGRGAPYLPEDEAAMKKWSDRVIDFEDRFPDQVKKFKQYMGWETKSDKIQVED